MSGGRRPAPRRKLRTILVQLILGFLQPFCVSPHFKLGLMLSQMGCIRRGSSVNVLLYPTALTLFCPQCAVGPSGAHRLQ